MKKLSLLLIPVLLLPLSLTSCSKQNETGTKLIISEVVEGSGNNKAIELYNLGDKELDLSSYQLILSYSEEISYKISLEGKLSANETYVIANPSADQELISKANLVSEYLIFNGDQTIELKKGSKLLDIVGIKGYYSGGWYKDVTLARKAEYLIGRKTFDEYDWIRYNENNFKYIGTIEVSLTEKDLLAGPKLTKEDRSALFSYIPSTGTERLGGGGITMVMVSSYVDGDTTVFSFVEDSAKEAGIPLTSKVRYQNIDTPESYTGNIQEFGLVAKDYTKNELKKAGMIYIQSLKDGPLFETFGRVLGWVWADDALMNHKIVKAGYSYVAFSSVDNMLYKDVSYTNFLYDAMLYAQKNKLGLHGEVDPYWDYKNNCVKDGNEGSQK